MNRPPLMDRYGNPNIWLHWITLLLLAAVYACIELREFLPKGSAPREALKTWHFMLGLTVFALTVPRLLIRLRSRAPHIVPLPPAWQRGLAGIVHIALYVLLLGMPLLGWLLLSAAGKPIPFFGLELPALTGPDKAFASTVKEIHETAGTIGYWLIGLHAAAALFHHYVARDNTLLRMLPAKR